MLGSIPEAHIAAFSERKTGAARPQLVLPDHTCLLPGDTLEEVARCTPENENRRGKERARNASWTRATDNRATYEFSDGGNDFFHSFT